MDMSLWCSRIWSQQPMLQVLHEHLKEQAFKLVSEHAEKHLDMRRVINLPDQRITIETSEEKWPASRHGVTWNMPKILDNIQRSTTPTQQIICAHHPNGLTASTTDILRDSNTICWGLYLDDLLVAISQRLANCTGHGGSSSFVHLCFGNVVTGRLWLDMAGHLSLCLPLFFFLEESHI